MSVNLGDESFISNIDSNSIRLCKSFCNIIKKSFIGFLCCGVVVFRPISLVIKSGGSCIKKLNPFESTFDFQPLFSLRLSSEGHWCGSGSHWKIVEKELNLSSDHYDYLISKEWLSSLNCEQFKSHEIC